MEQRYYICNTCRNLVDFKKNSGVPVFCCGNKMEEVEAKTEDAMSEKHLPLINVEGNKVTVSVGTVPHAMNPDHFIEWIDLETKEGTQRKILAPGVEPKAVFAIAENDEVKAAYAYCSLLSLWKTEL